MQTIEYTSCLLLSIVFVNDTNVHTYIIDLELLEFTVRPLEIYNFIEIEDILIFTIIFEFSEIVLFLFGFRPPFPPSDFHFYCHSSFFT